MINNFITVSDFSFKVEKAEVTPISKKYTVLHNRQKWKWKGMKKIEVTKKKNRSSEKDKLPKDKSNKSIYILGSSMVKHLEGWKLKKSIDKNHVFLGQR